MRVAPFLLLPLLFLAGCPEPVEELSAAGGPGGAPPPGQPGGPPPGDGSGAPGQPGAPGEGGAPDAPGEGAVPGEGAAPVDGAAAAGVPADGALPPGPTPPADLTTRSLKSLAKGGATVKIRGTLKGATKAQVDFTAVTDLDGQKAPEILQIVQVTDGTFEVEAPATFDREIYITASADEKGDGISPDDPGGMAAPVQLTGSDVTVEITVGTDGVWMKSLPWSMGGPPGSAPQ